MLADRCDVVIGVDTHKDTHAFALVDACTGELVLELELPATRAGYRSARAQARRCAGGARVWALEGSGSYGAGLARFLARQGERVLEVERPPRRRERGRGKSDRLDALRAARLALAGEPLASPRTGGRREALRIVLTAREGAIAVRRAALNQLQALLVSAPEPLRERLRSLPRGRLLDRCARLRTTAAQEPELRASVLALRTLARRVEQATREADELEREIIALVRELSPALLVQPGIGPISAAQLLISWSHQGRLRSESAFARLAGAAPIPASSGKTIRHRLDRGGDRRLNRALHTIVVSRRKHHPETIA
jgi:transposase